MFIERVPRWYFMSVCSKKGRDGRGRHWLDIKIYPNGMKWLKEENLATVTFVKDDPGLGPFLHLQERGSWFPFGYQGIGIARTQNGGAQIQLPLMPKDGQGNLVSATLAALNVVLGTEPEDKAKENHLEQLMLMRFTYNDRPQGRSIVGCLSPRLLQMVNKSTAWRRKLVLRRATRIARDIWNGPPETSKVPLGSRPDEDLGDFFERNPFELKENWFMIGCPGNATGLAAKQTYSHDPEESLLFSGCNIDSPMQQLCLLGAFAAIFGWL